MWLTPVWYHPFDTHSVDALQDGKVAVELRLQDAVSSKGQLTKQLQSTISQLEASHQAHEATATQLKTAQVHLLCSVNIIVLRACVHKHGLSAHQRALMYRSQSSLSTTACIIK